MVLNGMPPLLSSSAEVLPQAPCPVFCLHSGRRHPHMYLTLLPQALGPIWHRCSWIPPISSFDSGAIWHRRMFLDPLD